MKASSAGTSAGGAGDSAAAARRMLEATRRRDGDRAHAFEVDADGAAATHRDQDQIIGMREAKLNLTGKPAQPRFATGLALEVAAAHAAAGGAFEQEPQRHVRGEAALAHLGRLKRQDFRSIDGAQARQLALHLLQQWRRARQIDEPQLGAILAAAFFCRHALGQPPLVQRRHVRIGSPAGNWNRQSGVRPRTLALRAQTPGGREG